MGELVIEELISADGVVADPDGGMRFVTRRRWCCRRDMSPRSTRSLDLNVFPGRGGFRHGGLRSSVHRLNKPTGWPCFLGASGSISGTVWSS